AYGEGIRVLPVLDIIHARNLGAAFSMLADQSGWQRWFFTVLAIGVAITLVVWLRRIQARSQALLACRLSLILVSPVRNVIQRIRLGHVTDFIYVHWKTYDFPAFNVADSAITVGAALLLLDVLLEGRRAKAQQAKAVAKADGGGAA